MGEVNSVHVRVAAPTKGSGGSVVHSAWHANKIEVRAALWLAAGGSACPPCARRPARRALTTPALARAGVCTRAQVLNQTSGLKCTFNAGRWIGTDDWTVTLPQSTCEQVLQTYRVQVYTSSLPGASFDGEAYVKINGWYGSTDEIQLAATGRSTSSFSAGSCQVRRPFRGALLARTASATRPC